MYRIQESAASDLLELLEESSNDRPPSPTVCEEREKELQQITDYILQMYRQYDLSTDEYRQKIPCLEAKYKVPFQVLRNDKTVPAFVCSEKVEMLSISSATRT